MTPTLVLAIVGFVATAGVAALIIARSLSVPRTQLSHAFAQLGVVRLKELERSWRGRTDEARIELLRQLLEEARVGQPSLRPMRAKSAALAAASAIALGLVGASMLAMREDAGSASAVASASAFTAQDPDLARLELYAKSKAPRTASAAPMSRPAELPDVETMIERLAARLETTPNDVEGWRMLGWSYFNLQQAPKAVEAYARAVALEPQAAALKAAYGEAMVAAEGGSVTAQAAEMFNAVLAIEGGNVKARYYLALADAQNGKKQQALDTWIALLAEPLDEEPWVAELRQHSASLARELNVDIAARVPNGPGRPAAREMSAAVGKPGVGPRALTPEEMQTAQALPADRQQAMIRGMVNGLADRLRQKPRDEEGWLRLMQSRVVLGEEGAAREALERALAVFSDDASAGARISAAARDLGIANN
jgi:cytochrome c-type biogenesis protein CcmH